MLIKDRPCKDLEAYKRFLEECKLHTKLKHKNLVTVFGFVGSDDNELFGKSFRVSLYFEYINHDLQREVRARNDPFSNIKAGQLGSTPRYFKESELLGITE